MGDDRRYAIGDLADLAGVSRRTVRYYVEENLLPPPYGVGRGNHYGREHLDEILRVKALQEAGRTLDEIRNLRHPGRRARTAQMPEVAEPLSRTLWRRLTLAPGVELHLSGEVRLPSQRTLHELASWCRTHLARADEREDTDA
jgi:DNA-binding transcriptional MerR regulator